MTDLEKSREVIESAARRLEVEVTSLLAALDTSAKKFKAAQDAALNKMVEARRQGASGEEPIDILVFGSMARGEMSADESDFDYVLVAYTEITDPSDIVKAREAAEGAKVAIELKAAGTFGGFGGLVSALNLINLIGLETDTNQNHTYRILALMESISLLGKEGRKKMMKALLERYLYDYREQTGGQSKQGVPRFLLHDISRYWRTLGVDYQGKRWEELHGEKWGIRYLKLRSTRKLAYAGTLVSLFLPRILKVDVTAEVLLPQFELTPLARLAQLEEYLDDRDRRDTLRDILSLADYFSERLSDGGFRITVSKVEHPRSAEVPPEFREARERTMVLEDLLERLFTSDRALVVHAGGESRKADSMKYLTNRYLLF